MTDCGFQEGVADKFDGVRKVKPSSEVVILRAMPEGSLTCPPHSYGRRGFFAEFTLSRLFRFFTAFRMTRGEGLRMTILGFWYFFNSLFSTNFFDDLDLLVRKD
jgi:hypothetical protein